MSEKSVFDPLTSLTTKEGGWVVILLLQGIYLSLDVAEVSTEKIAFGVSASVFMGLLGLLIIFYSIRDYFLKKERVLEGFIEGVFYTFFAIILWYYKHKRSKQSQEIKNDLEIQRAQNQVFQNRLQALKNTRLYQ